jgi:cephalosporin-C deacetylase-like acetyl esterase
VGFVELKVLVLVAVAVYVGLAGLVWVAQESLMFYPRPALGPAAAPAGWHLHEVDLATSDGTRIAGVLVRPPVDRAPLVIYFGGNAEEVTAASEKALVADALELFDWVAGQPGIDPARVCVHGRSLGSSIAVQVAAARPVGCVVLTSPFASALDVAREVYGWLPVAWLMRHPFDSAAHAPKIKAPLLMLVGSADAVIRPHHSERLASLWGGTVEKVMLPGFGHNDVHLDPRYGEAIRAFLDRHQK